MDKRDQIEAIQNPTPGLNSIAPAFLNVLLYHDSLKSAIILTDTQEPFSVELQSALAEQRLSPRSSHLIPYNLSDFLAQLRSNFPSLHLLRTVVSPETILVPTEETIVALQWDVVCTPALALEYLLRLDGHITGIIVKSLDYTAYLRNDTGQWTVINDWMKGKILYEGVIGAVVSSQSTPVIVVMRRDAGDRLSKSIIVRLCEMTGIQTNIQPSQDKPKEPETEHKPVARKLFETEEEDKINPETAVEIPQTQDEIPEYQENAPVISVSDGRGDREVPPAVPVSEAKQDSAGEAVTVCCICQLPCENELCNDCLMDLEASDYRQEEPVTPSRPVTSVQSSPSTSAQQPTQLCEFWGYENAPGFQKCFLCGLVNTSAPETPPSKPSEGWKCKNCNSLTALTTYICRSCGKTNQSIRKQIEAKQGNWICKCNTVNNKRYCTSCFTDMPKIWKCKVCDKENYTEDCIYCETEEPTKEADFNAEQDVWACEQCTFWNPMTTYRCESCNYTNYDLMSVLIMDKAYDTKWTCAHCFMQNASSSSICSKCYKPKQERPSTSSVPRTQEKQDVWICPRCHNENSKKLARCQQISCTYINQDLYSSLLSEPRSSLRTTAPVKYQCITCYQRTVNGPGEKCVKCRYAPSSAGVYSRANRFSHGSNRRY